MPFGMKGAPAHFQRAVHLTINTGEGEGIVIYIDDIVVSGASWKEVWGKTLKVITKLVKAGFKINLAKCHFMTNILEVVGMEVVAGAYRAKPEKLKVLLGARIPTTYKELQKLVG